MKLNYTKLQKQVKDLIVKTFGGIACTITAMDGGTLNTYVVFDQGKLENIDNRQNPTPIIGLNQQLAYVPGDITFVPDVGGTLTYKLKVGPSLVTYEKRIAVVNVTQPGSVPLLYRLTVE